MDLNLSNILSELKMNNSLKSISASQQLKEKLTSSSSRERKSTLKQLFLYSPKFVEILSCLSNAENVCSYIYILNDHK